jgi:hypothetical protein
MYLVCSRCRIPLDLPVWPTHELLHVLHFNLYIPLEFALFNGILSRTWLYMVLLVRKAVFKFVFFNKFVTVCECTVCECTVCECAVIYKGDQLFLCVCVGVTFVLFF